MNNKDMPASPGVRYCTVKEDGTWSVQISTGLTKLEDFTKAALQGLLANSSLSNSELYGNRSFIKRLAHHAVIAAEETLAELEKRNDQTP